MSGLMGMLMAKKAGGLFIGDVFNSADKASQITLTNGGATANLLTTQTGWKSVRSVNSQSSGKYYVEFFINTLTPTGAYDIMVGVATSSPPVTNWLGNHASGWVYAENGHKGNNGSLVSHGGSFTQGDTVGVALDLDAGKVWFSVNGTFTGDPGAGTGEAFSGVTGNIFMGASLIKTTGTSDKVVTLVSNPSDLAFSAPAGFSEGWPQ